MAAITKSMMTALHKDVECGRSLRLRCSSSGSVFKPPTARFISGSQLQITGTDFVCDVAAGVVALRINDKPAKVVVAGNTFGVEGVWIQIAVGSQFWIEVYAPSLTDKQQR